MTLNEILASDQPYFGGFMIAEQGSAYFHHFPRLIERLGVDEPVIVEVGSWAGHSLIAWDNAAKGRARLYVVDPWEPYQPPNAPSQQMMNEFARTGDIFRLFMHNVRTSGMLGRVSVFMCPAQTMLPLLPAGFADLVFIDGDHKYEAVRNDIENAKRVVRRGGILCGDDLELQLHQVNAEDNLRHINAGLDFSHYGSSSYHPGITQAVHEAFGTVAPFDRMWAVINSDQGWRSL